MLFTPSLGIPIPAVGDGAYAATINAALFAYEALQALGPLGVKFKENPSVTLNVAVAAGSFRNAAGAIVSYAGIASQTMTTAATNYLYLTDAGALVVNTTGFPSGVNYVPLATVVAGAGVITSVADSRPVFTASGRAGPILPAVLITTATATLSAANPYVQVNRAGAVALTLPAASATPIGATIVIQDVSGAALVNNITITRAGADTINGAAAAIIMTNYGGVKLWCDGVSAWFILP